MKKRIRRKFLPGPIHQRKAYQKVKEKVEQAMIIAAPRRQKIMKKEKKAE